MFDFGNANDGQKDAISAADGPVLITAGPGTGKTYTLVQRAIYLIQEKGVQPEQIMMATFTEKAAKELITRITNELAARNIFVNINEMYIGTFHSICLRILKDNLEFSSLKKNYRMLEPFDQQYLVFSNYGSFRKDIPNIGSIIPQGTSTWDAAGFICSKASALTEEMAKLDEMLQDSKEEIRVLAAVTKKYSKLLEEGNLLDYSKMQTECYKLLKDNPSVLKALQDKIKYLMIDEYQDTNYIQEQLVFLIGGRSGNICVVGDDDQGLYRFRGATIRNILEFPQKFAPGACRIIPLTVNYRSNSDIIDFYNNWMTTTTCFDFGFSWGNYRFSKQIQPSAPSALGSKAVIKLSGTNPQSWHEKILQFIRSLRASGKITDYNQIAFLFTSVKNPQVKALADYLERNGINVYSPRSDMFFEREEIRLALGLLMLLFPAYVEKLESNGHQYLTGEQRNYYLGCLRLARELLTEPENSELRNEIDARGNYHKNLPARGKATNYAYTVLLYKLFSYEPFRSMLGTDLGTGVIDTRPSRNLAILTKITAKFEYIQGLNVLTGKDIDGKTEILFNLFIRLLCSGGITEYEDDSEYAPSGCVSFMTIHQSKGMEFPIVFVGSLGRSPYRPEDPLMNDVEDRFYRRTPFEPRGDIKYFDFWRLFYTAFSRAQDLLVLTCAEDRKTPSPCFADAYASLPAHDSPDFDLNEFDFHTVKDVSLKENYSFTSHISVYETCPRQYKFFKELGFSPVRQNAMIFGILVHETVEDIHRAAIRDETDLITEENIGIWLESNYNSLVKSEHTYLAPAQKKAALQQVLRYAERQQGDWSMIKQTEVDVSLVQPDYIIKGKIDLIKGDDQTVDIIDFKSEKKPDPGSSKERLEHYRDQLRIYAYLVEQRTGQKVRNMRLYYTADESDDPTVTFPYEESGINDTVSAFDETVHKIMCRDFSGTAKTKKTCDNCDFRFYCTDKPSE